MKSGLFKLICSMWLIPLCSVHAQGQESGTTLFSSSSEKFKSELSIKGSWAADVLGTIQVAFPFATRSPSVTGNLLFLQSPDLFIQYSINDKFFVEARTGSELSKTLYSAYYLGSEGEALKELRIGNDKIGFPVLPFLSFGESDYRSFGTVATIAAQNFTGKAMLRYDQATKIVRYFSGTTEYQDSVIKANEYIEGQFLIVSDAPALNLEVYIKSTTGSAVATDGNTYRKMQATEYSYSVLTGIISLTTPASAKIIARHDNIAARPDNISFLDGRQCEVLFDPPANHESITIDPLRQILSRYASVADTALSIAYIRDTASQLRDDSYLASIHNGYIEVSNVPPISQSQFNTSQLFRQPFADDIAKMPWLYTTDFANSSAATYQAALTKEIVVRSIASTNAIVLDSDYIPGSVEVTRNGNPEYGFSVNPDTLEVTLNIPAANTDRISVSYLQASSVRKDGSIAAALGGFWDLAPGWSSYIALGGRWSIPGQAYSSDGTVTPGNIVFTAGNLYQTQDNLGVSAFHGEAFAASHIQEDASSIYRIEDMESTTGANVNFIDTAFSAKATVTCAPEVGSVHLESSFPAIIKKTHSGGAIQKILSITATSAYTAGTDLEFYKIVARPPYESYTRFSFFARFSNKVHLILSMDRGSEEIDENALRVELPAGTGNGNWQQFWVDYGNASSQVMTRDNENDPGRAVIGANIKHFPDFREEARRLYIKVSGLESGESISLDEVLLENSNGSNALLFQTSAGLSTMRNRLDNSLIIVTRTNTNTGYLTSDMDLNLSEYQKTIKISPFSMYDGLLTSANFQGSLADASAFSGSAYLRTRVAFVGLGIRANAGWNPNASFFRGGHEILLPDAAFPLSIYDRFDFDPLSGAFGRTDSIGVVLGSAAKISATQTSNWHPPYVNEQSELLDIAAGLFDQTWDFRTQAAGNRIGIFLTANKRGFSKASAIGGAQDYPRAWIGSFKYLLPAAEADSTLRQINLGFSGSTWQRSDAYSAGLVDFSYSASTYPQAINTYQRETNINAKIAPEFNLGDYYFSPYLMRQLLLRQNGSASSFAGDAEKSLVDVRGYPMLLQSIPFYELGAEQTANEFAQQSLPGNDPFYYAKFNSGAGLSIRRNQFLGWTGLIIPSQAVFDFYRNLERSATTLTDSNIFDTTLRFVAIDVTDDQNPSWIRSYEYSGTAYGMFQFFRDSAQPALQYSMINNLDLHIKNDKSIGFQNQFSYSKNAAQVFWSEYFQINLVQKDSELWIFDFPPLNATSSKVLSSGNYQESNDIFNNLGANSTIYSTIFLTGMLQWNNSDTIYRAWGWKLEQGYSAEYKVPNRIAISVGTSLAESVAIGSNILIFSLSLHIGTVLSF